METNKACYSITINAKVGTTPENFTVKSLELEDCISSWLSEGSVDQYTVNCDLDNSEVEYEITSEADTLVAKMVFIVAPKDDCKKVEMLKPKMRAVFMDVSNNAFPTCSITKKQAV